MSCIILIQRGPLSNSYSIESIIPGEEIIQMSNAMEKGNRKKLHWHSNPYIRHQGSQKI
jgi:hypothetical protein